MRREVFYCLVSTTTSAGAKWRGTRAIADQALVRKSAAGRNCSLSVVGAGWSGVYFSWRLAVDTSTLPASSVCVFEANGRVGGRIDSIHDLPGFDDLALDVGGYRFIETDLLPAQLVWNALELPTACYDWNCTGGCQGTTNCYVVKDAYGNNAGYATPIETMLGQLEDQGAGVFFGYNLQKVSFDGSFTLGFAGGLSASGVDKVVLALPQNTIAALDLPPLNPLVANVVYERVVVNAMNKVYAFYDDAWWSTKLGIMEGTFSAEPRDNATAPLQGRYHDGPQKCVIGRDPDGRPIYSGTKLPYGNCSGAIEVYYSTADDFYRQFMFDDLTPVTVETQRDDGFLSKSVHAALMAYHAASFRALGLDPNRLAPPATVVLANWIADGAFTPGIGFFAGTNYARKLARQPLPNLFIANQDYGYKSGWANGGLLMAEKILQAEFGLPQPTWLDTAYYGTYVLGVP